jgi:hypothetical protein
MQIGLSSSFSFVIQLYLYLSLIILEIYERPDELVHYHSSCHTFETPGVRKYEELDVHLLRLSNALWIRKPFLLVFEEKKSHNLERLKTKFP